MGYCAGGSGCIHLKENIDLVKVEEIIDSYQENFDELSLEEYPKDGKVIFICESTNHWDEENISNFLNDIEPFTKDGTINYSGEEDCIWRYVFDTDKCRWIEENASIDYNMESYSDNDLISELKKRGYDVVKKSKTSKYYATNIKWEIDVDEYVDEEDVNLPDKMEIPEEFIESSGIIDVNAVSDWLSEDTGYLHNGFTIEAL